MDFKWGVEAAGPDGAKRAVPVVDLKAVAAEFLAMTLFVVIGCGTACGHGASDAATRAVVAFAFGSGILVLAYTFGHHSGAQINCAVTLSLVLGGKLAWYQGIANAVGQFVGSLAGASFLAALVPCDQDLTTNLGTNIVNPEYGPGNAMFAEIIGTFFLCIVVWEVALSPLSTAGPNAAIAIGFAVFLAHCFLLPIDGCSINPSRSFGPAVVGSLRACDGYADSGLADLRVMFMGPLVGGALAAIAKTNFAVQQKSAEALEEKERAPAPAPAKHHEAPAAVVAPPAQDSALRAEARDPHAVVLDIAAEPGPEVVGRGADARPKGHRGGPAARRAAAPAPKGARGRWCLPLF